MERGGLTGFIPSTFGIFDNLYFLNLDFNQLTGYITSELLTKDTLEQLDINDNRLSGNVEGIDSLRGFCISTAPQQCIYRHYTTRDWGHS